jgi:hypothetical protein
LDQSSANSSEDDADDEAEPAAPQNENFEDITKHMKKRTDSSETKQNSRSPAIETNRSDSSSGRKSSLIQ